MQNAIVAKLFDDIADYLEVAGENSFKIRAYRKAAEAVAGYERPIEAVTEGGELEKIEGLGQATAQKVREFLATGQIRYLERLREEYPEGLIELLSVPNLGPKKVQLLYRERGISNIDQLKDAIARGELAGLAGFGPKTIGNIQQGLARLAEMSRELPLAVATNTAANLMEALGAQGSVQRVEVAGAVRRGCDTVGSIDIVVATSEPDIVQAAFIASPFLLALEGQSETLLEAKVRPGVTARLHCTSAADFGLTLFLATGNAAHLAEAERLAAEQGIALQLGAGYGDEEQIFAALGASFIEPELREGGAEWEMARTGTLPDLLELRDLRGDLHSHSTWSDGALSIRQMAEAAQARGYSYLAVTDHSKALAMANGLDAKRLREQALEIAEVQAGFPDLKILRGVECDIMRDGSLDLDDEILHELDIVVASVHSGFTLDEAAQTERMIRALRHPAVDVVAHPTGRVLGIRPGYDVNIAALIEAAREAGTALEINASERLDLSDKNAALARAAGVLLSIDSDAHSARMLPNVGYGVSTARRAWCRKSDILNTKSTEELLQWLKRPQAQA